MTTSAQRTNARYEKIWATARKIEKDEVLKMLERKDKEREAEIKKVKLSNMPSWEKKMVLKALRSGTFGGQL